jgi:carbon-monoxide dehydrogenase medium subunit
MSTLGGEVVARSLRGTRRIAADAFYQGIMTTSLDEDELIVACELPTLADGTRSGFMEHSRRKGDFAVAMALITYRLESGLIAEPRIGIGGAEAHARRLTEVEDSLRGKAPRTEAFAAAADIAATICDPIEDINNTIGYRRSIVRTMVLRALESAA